MLLLLLALGSGIRPGVPWLLLPLVLVLFMAFCFGIALVLSVVTVFFRDVTQVVALVVQFWFWLTPVVYDAAALGPRLTAVMHWNPVTPFIVGVRGLLVEGTIPSAASWLTMIGWAVSLSVVGGLMIRRLRSDLRDAL